MPSLAQAGALFFEGRLEEAVEAYRAILEAQPESPDALYQFAIVRQAQGRQYEALELVSKAASLMPAEPRLHALRGFLLDEFELYPEALAAYERAIELDPNDADSQNNRGVLLDAIGREEDAALAYARALEIQPDLQSAVFNTAMNLVKLDRDAQALELLERRFGKVDDSAPLCALMGRALWKIGRLGEARARFERALELAPELSQALSGFAALLEEEGELERAEELLLRAIQVAPNSGAVYMSLASLRRDAVTPEHLARLEELGRQERRPIDRIAIDYALGNILAASDPARSFAHLSAANRARRSVQRYDERVNLESFQLLATTFTAEFIHSRAGLGDDTARPIFVFGMPRSGTTLVEQILASHPLVHAGGELEFLGEIVDEIVGGGRPTTPASMHAATKEQLAEIGRRYDAELRKISGSKPYTTDKLPNNFKYAGLISVAMPNAKMIHARRDILDVCVSCFSINFQSTGLAFTNDVGELGRYARGYLDVMKHWNAVLPAEAMLTVDYEDVVERLEPAVRRILEYCRLPWDDRCLEFYKTKRPVKTASVTQVRKPIYRGSVGRARPYGGLLDPLRAALFG
ncbi:MAG: sulfotransferase [Candidatus Eremiobacteraeota bacterium]|nr:sulfotransferase [Candidatus Eremiobacteraeota bacterium]